MQKVNYSSLTFDMKTKKYIPLKNKKIYNFNTIKIQSYYRGFYTRKKLKIYYNLPRDLQRKVIWYFNKDIYLKCFNSSVSSIIYRRIKTFCRNNKFILTNINKYIYSIYNTYDSKTVDLMLNELYDIIKLINKYHIIINIKKIHYELSLIINYVYKTQFHYISKHNQNYTNMIKFIHISIKNKYISE